MSNPYERLVRRIGHSRWFALLGRHVLTPMDRRLRGRRFSVTTLGTSFPLCHLTTTGRRSGQERTSPLLFVTVAAGRVVAETNFGSTHRPAWALNLEADPRATLEIDGRREAVTARPATAVERAEAWPLLNAVWPAFDRYAERADRPIVLFVLEAEPLTDA